ncbi:MAG: diphthamide biosynthesis enzyme Dph2 [Methanocellales archaeon]|nr:diphthamide biosynthesis enzyme Dph2 [Methanocellales archaeon]
MNGLDFDMGRITSIIGERSAKKVGLQFPAGLKRSGLKIAKETQERTGAITYISGSSCYGACDVDDVLRAYVDILFHFGHAEMEPIDKVVFIEVRSNADIIPALRQALKMLKGDSIGLVTTVQHVHKLDEAKDFLTKHGKTCIVGRGDSRIRYNGQVLGCNFSVACVNADEFVYIGSGDFHPLGIALATGKRVIVADPTLNEAREVEPKLILRQRHAIIAKALDAKSFGIIVSTKRLQMRLGMAEKLCQKAQKRDIDTHMIFMDEVKPEMLAQFKVDAFVSTACPRIAIDDVALFKKPVLTPIEFEIVLGERDWSEIKFDEILGGTR